MSEKASLGEVVRPRESRIGIVQRLLVIVLGAICVGLVTGRFEGVLGGRDGGWRWGGKDGNEVVVGVRRWSEVIPSEELIWHRCYDIYDCARLDVPLDWLVSDSRKVTIAIIRYNATERLDYKGPVFINPGGPGGSGIWFVKHLAPYYQYVVGRNHDIISFDPRGVGATTPSINCWNDSLSSSSSVIWDLQEPPVIDAHPGILYDAYAHAKAFSQQCKDNIGEIGRYVSTPNVARDMLHIAEKLGQEKIKYWGFSYGTFLGVTFASLFPDKVERMVNDGNVDAIDYVSGRGTHFLADTDKVMSAFYRFCHQAGPSLCALYDTSPLAIEARLSLLLANIKMNPVIVPALLPMSNRPEILSYSNIRRMISSALYRPLVMFPPLAEALAALEVGDGRPFLNLARQGGYELSLCQNSYHASDGDVENPTPEIPEAEGSADASKAIFCSDGEDVPDGVEKFGQYMDILQNLSFAAGATMASMILSCVGWKLKGKWQYTGPFEGNTSHPILFIANTADNVTPRFSALRNAKGFPGSVVVTQDSYGHTSLCSPSRCTALTIRAYFQNGTLPEPGTVCPTDLVPFEPWDTISSKKMPEGLDNSTLDYSLMKLMNAPVVVF